MWRDPLAIIAVVLVALLSSTSAGIHQTASLTVSGFVDLHWRGAYDILVRPAGTRLDLEQTNGIVEPNFVGFAGSGGIGLDGLSAVRSIRGVDLAAPIGFVGYLRGAAPTVTVYFDHLPSKPTLFRLTMVTTTTDGLTRLPVQSETGEVLVGPVVAGDNPTANWATTFGSLTGSHLADGSWAVIIASSRVLPDLAVPVIAVDPSAEDALLAGKAPFLAALPGGGPNSRTAGSFDMKKVASGFRSIAGRLEAIQSPQWSFPADRDLPVIPLVVSTRQAADLKVDLKVEQVGHPLDAYPEGGDLAQAAADAGPGFSLVGAATSDAGTAVAPLQPPMLCVLWPGSSGPCSVGTLSAASTLDGRLVVRPTYTTTAGSGPDNGAPAFRITQVGVVGPDGAPSIPDPGHSGSATTGNFPAYRQMRDVPLAVLGTNFRPHASIRQPFFLTPVGTFDANAVELPSDLLDYVPLGAYDPSDTTDIAGPDGKPVRPTKMKYPLLPNGLVTTPPLAITDLLGAQTLRGGSPIDAIRVRVAGVTDYGPDSKARIEAVAEAIGRLGFAVDIVAGSSPRNVDIYVPAYHVDQTPPTDLGWVRQHWTTLGAAQRVTNAFDASDLALLALSLASAAIWAFALAALRIERKVRDAAVLKAVGWSRLEILRWLLAETTLGATLVAVLATVGFLLAGGSPEALAVALGMAGLWMMAGIVAALAAIRRGRPESLGSSGGQHRLAAALPVGGPTSYAFRAALARWPWVGATAIGLAAGAAAIALGLALIGGLSERLGPTLLASATGATAAFYQPLMLATVGAGSLAFVLAGLRLDRRRRAPEVVILSVSGWSNREIRNLLWLGLVPVAALATILAILGVLVLASSLEIRDPRLPVAGAAVLAATVLLWGSVFSKGVAVGPGEIR